jgi:hypothetical protein
MLHEALDAWATRVHDAIDDFGGGVEPVPDERG